MLTLSRKIDEQIMIGDDIIVTVCYIDAERVRIGVDAPLHVQVDRKEVRRRKDKQREQAK